MNNIFCYKKFILEILNIKICNNVQLNTFIVVSFCFMAFLMAEQLKII